MYAIIETGGKQYRVSEGDILFIEKLNAEADSTVEFDRVIAAGNDGDLKFGTPVVEGAKVTARSSRTARGRRSPSSPIVPRRTPSARWGHRQPYTKVQIESITL